MLEADLFISGYPLTLAVGASMGHAVAHCFEKISANGVVAGRAEYSCYATHVRPSIHWLSGGRRPVFPVRLIKIRNLDEIRIAIIFVHLGHAGNDCNGLIALNV